LASGHIVIILIFGILVTSTLLINNTSALENGLYEGQWVRYGLEGPEIKSSNDALRLLFQKQLNDQFTIPVEDESYTPDEIKSFNIKIEKISGLTFEVVRSIDIFGKDELTLFQTSERIDKWINPIIDFGMPIDTEIGDLFSDEIDFSNQLRVKEIIVKEFAGEQRKVFHLFSSSIKEDGATFTETSKNVYFDKETGIFLGSEYKIVAANVLLGSIEGSFVVKATEMSEKPLIPSPISSLIDSNGGGCLIATATFGTELSPQVQMLREIRDNLLLQTQSGQSFMQGFNEFYYSFSPAIADYERENPFFKETVKIAITPLITSLSILNFVDMESESDVLSYGISLILLNVGMYFVAPTIIIYKIRTFVYR